jgi:hypothetical protein
MDQIGTNKFFLNNKIKNALAFGLVGTIHLGF